MRFFCEKSRMFSKAKGFVFKGLFHVWEKNKFFSYSLGVKHGCEKSWCKQPLHKSDHNYLEGYYVGSWAGYDTFLFVFNWTVKSGQPDAIKVWFFPTQQTDLWNVCQILTSPFIVKSTPTKNCTPDTTAKQQEAERWGTGFLTSSSRAHPQWCNSSSYFGNCFHFPILICLRLWILKRCQLRFYLLIFLSFFFLDLQNPQYLVIFR